ncbi:M16 family metallopeptidase [Rhizohabitans arisaemae]|uniref:M16 family metallopeptidase n=1 Tax=Rhizohabitans arisaemae TaxID=2720610 RepID=UPI0024B0D566|nr:insulinase family protein [Rhizohabitans arisaemae]
MDRLTTTPVWRFPAARTLLLDSGMRVKLVDMPGRFIASVAVVVDLPTEVETPDVEGVVAAYATMMLSDAPHARADLVSEVAKAGGMITTRCSHRGPVVVADCPMSELPSLFRALVPMLMRFEPTARSFDKLRRRIAAERVFEASDPAGLANKLLNESVLEPASRYSRPLGGSEAAWRHLTLDDVAELFETRVGPQRMTLIVVGDLGMLDAAKAAAEAFGGYPAQGRLPVADRPPVPDGTPRLLCRPGPGGPQTRLMLGCFGIDRLDPRWPSARAAAELLGAGPDSLLNVEVRGRLGLSYGIEARFLPFHAGGVFVVHGAVDGARSEHAAAAILRTLHGMCRGAVDTERFARVRSRMVGSAPEIYESALAVAHQYVELVSCGIHESFIDEHLNRLGSLGVDQMVTDFRSIIDPDSLHVVAVGRFDPDVPTLAGSVLSGLERG